MAKRRHISDRDRGLTAEILRMLVLYNPATGEFFWQKPGLGRNPIDKRAGWQSNSRWHMQLPGWRSSFLCSRLAYLYMTGEWPKGEIDHINHNKSDDRWENLRDATSGQNKANIGKRSHNTSGILGVSVCSDGRWWAQCRIHNVIVLSKKFKTKEEAMAARGAAVVKHHGEFAFKQ